MRAWVVAIALIAACKGKDKGGTTETAKAALVAPKVAVATVLAKNDRPPVLYLLDGSGSVKLGAATTWTALDAGEIVTSKKARPIHESDLYVREAFALGRAPVETVQTWDTVSDTDVDLSAVEDVKTRSAGYQDDPPPPAEDDGADESGGTGTAIALEEGKLGKMEDRVEGQYKMKKVDGDPQLARQQAIEEAKRAGILAENTGSSMGGLPYADATKPVPTDDGLPTRVAEVEGVAAVNGQLERLRAMIVIDPMAKASKLIAAIRDTGAAIGVSHDGKLRPLDLQFDVRDTRLEPGWMEVRVSAKGLLVEGVPDAAIEVADPKQLGEALSRARSARGLADDLPVDVLVESDVDVQRMIDIAVALRTAGVKTIGFGAAPPPEELARRGHRIPSLRFGQPLSQGDLDKALIRKTVKQARPQLKACYDAALAKNPALSGTVSTQFFITPNGSVAASSASGIDLDLSQCIAAAIKKLEFPKPNGGGGVQVNYPFMMRP